MRRKKHRPQRKNLAQLEGLDDHPVRSSRLTAAAHYDGDTSNYKLGHTHYEGKKRRPGSVTLKTYSVIRITSSSRNIVTYLEYVSSSTVVKTVNINKLLG
jgi:hypothetical protein